MLNTLYKIGKPHFRLLGTNGFHVKTMSERFTAVSSCCRQNLKYENFTSSFGRLRQNVAPKSVLHVQHDYFSSFNQSNHWFVALSLTLPSSDLKLPIMWVSGGCQQDCCQMTDLLTGLEPVKKSQTVRRSLGLRSPVHWDSNRAFVVLFCEKDPFSELPFSQMVFQ